jgi:peptide/nickel transport system substrate-binding protein
MRCFKTTFFRPSRAKFPSARRIAVSVCLGLALSAAPAHAAHVLRWASQGDAMTMDPHAQNEGQTLTFAQQIYEPLVERAPNLEKEPCLATSWQLLDPTTWEFKLREGVKFHDGRPFTADDVVFSFERAKSPTSDMREIIASITKVEAVNPTTVIIKTNGPDPILPDEVANIFIMSKSWAKEHGVMTPQDTSAGQETYAVRHTNGTGAFILDLREPDVRTTWKKNPNWWGLQKYPHNLDGITYVPIRNAATRVAAVLSGELDFVLDPPLQDLPRLQTAGNLVVERTPEVRTIFLGMNTAAKELASSSIKGRNPFADIRVRKAMNMAVDVKAIVRAIMRGQAVPAGNIIPPGAHGYDEALDTHLPFDRDGAKALLAEAGYPDGFDVRLDCPNDRYINDEAICQAVVGMLARVGVKVTLDLKPRTLHFPKIQNAKTDFYMLGWLPDTYDAHNSLVMLATPASPWNRTGFADAHMLELIKDIGTEIDTAKRDAEIATASRLLRDGYSYIPLHHQMLAWVLRKGVELPITGSNKPHFRYAKMSAK